jgi:O-antigen ligase
MSSYEMFLDHPILGIGWRGFPVLLSEYAPPGYPWWSLVNESHTVLAAVLAELGIVGLVAALWFICRTFRLGIRGIGETQDPYLRAVVIGLVAVFVAFQVNQSLNGDFANNLFWFFTGMLFAVVRLDKETEAK